MTDKHIQGFMAAYYENANPATAQSCSLPRSQPSIESIQFRRPPRVPKSWLSGGVRGFGHLREPELTLFAPLP